MKKKYLMIGFAVLLNLHNSKATDYKIIRLENSKELIAQDIAERFTGAWEIVRLVPNYKPNDHSMEGLIWHLERYRNTKKTFVFHLMRGMDLVLSIKDEYNLVGVNANMNVRFNKKLNELILTLSSGNTIIFRKLE